jgi:hypothetical protein
LISASKVSAAGGGNSKLVNQGLIGTKIHEILCTFSKNTNAAFIKTYCTQDFFGFDLICASC